eukprot:15169267-Ditylum_brightwellii.AAC.1
MEFEHGQNINVGLLKKCMCCLMSIVVEWNSGMDVNGGENGNITAARGTSTTAGEHIFTVNLNVHTTPANQNADSKSSENANAIR